MPEQSSRNRFMPMRQYRHEDFVDLVSGLDESGLLELCANYGGYPVLFRMSLDRKLSHIPFIQTGAAVAARNEKGEILLQQRSDNGLWGLPGGCQNLGEKLETTAVRELYEETGIKISEDDLFLINTLSGESRRRVYANGDIVYNNTSLYLASIKSGDVVLKKDSESLRLAYFDVDNLTSEMNDEDLVAEYIKYDASLSPF